MVLAVPAVGLLETKKSDMYYYMYYYILYYIFHIIIIK